MIANIFRVIAVGRKNSKGYITKFYPESILAHTDYTKITMNMISYTPLSLSITSLIGVTISNVISESVTSVTNNNETISYSNTTLSTSDTIFLVDSESLSYIESYSTTVSVNLPCSSSGTTLITYSTGNYNGATPPAWVTINSSTGVMTINTPIITSASSDFSFYIYSSSGSFSNSVPKLVTITGKSKWVLYLNINKLYQRHFMNYLSKLMK